MWVIDLVLELIVSLANMFHRGKQLAPFLTGALGAMTPVLLLILVTDESRFWFDADVSSYLMLLTWLPSILIGTILGGLLGLHTEKTRPDSQVVLVAYIWGLIGGLIPGILLVIMV